MSRIDIIREELTTDPEGIVYDADNKIAAGQMNALTQSRDRASMSGAEIRETVDLAEYGALNTGQGNTADERNAFLIFTLGESLDPFSAFNVGTITDIFGVDSVSLANLAAARVETVSRATILDLNVVKVGEVEEARR